MRADQASTGGGVWGVIGAIVLAISVLASPLWLVSHPALVDFPNHLVRHVVSGAETPLQDFYTFSWTLQPNLAVDLLVVPLMFVFSPLVASKIVLSLGVALWVVAPVLLHRVLWARWSAWPVLAGLVALNGNLAFGFENYYLTAPVAILAFAGWLALRERFGRWVGFLFLVVFAWIVYCGHLFGWGILGLIVLSFSIGQLLRSPASLGHRVRDVVLPLCAFAPGGAHFVVAFLTAPVKHGTSSTYWLGAWVQKTVALWSPVYTFSQVGDAVMAIGVGVLVVLSVRRVRAHVQMIPVLVGFCIVSVAMPQTLMGVHFTDMRLPPVLVGLAVASVDPLDVRLGRWAPRAGLALLFVRVGSMLPIWWEHDRHVDELESAVRAVPQGSKMVVAQAGRSARPLQWNIVCYGAVERGLFVPTVFTGGFLLSPRAHVAHLDHPQAPPVPLEQILEDEVPSDGIHYWRDWRHEWDYMLVYTEEGEDPALDLPIVGSSEWFRVYRVVPDE